MRFPFICLSVFLLSLATTCHAELVTTTFDGELSYIFPGLESRFSIGDLMHVSITYDSLCPERLDTHGDPIPGVYDAIRSFSVSVDGYNATATSGHWSIKNDELSAHGDPHDQVFAYALAPITSSGGTLTGPPVNDMPLWLFFLQLHDNTGTALDSEALPVAFNPEDFDNNQLRLSWRDGGLNRYIAVTEFTSTSTIIPAPPAVLLGAIGLAVANWRLKRHSANRL